MVPGLVGWELVCSSMAAARVLLQIANFGFTHLKNRSIQRSEDSRNGLKTRLCNSTFLTAAAKLYVRGVADVADIGATWRRATGAPFGPFEIYGFVGIQTPYHLNAHNPDEEMQEFAKILKRDFIDKKQLGRGSGKGFYEYD